MTRQYSVAIVILISMISCQSVPPSAATSSTDDGQVVKEVATQFDSLAVAVRDHNWDTVESMFAEGEDVTLGMDGTSVVGRDNIMAAFRADNSILHYIDYRFDNTRIRPLGSDAAIHSTEFWEKLALRSGDTAEVAGTWTNAFQRISGKWRIVHMAASHRAVQP